MTSRRTIERAWQRRLDKAAKFRAKNPPPPPGSLKAGDICPCGCGGVMTDVNGVLTALSLDVVQPDGRVVRL